MGVAFAQTVLRVSENDPDPMNETLEALAEVNFDRKVVEILRLKDEQILQITY